MGGSQEQQVALARAGRPGHPATLLERNVYRPLLLGIELVGANPPRIFHGLPRGPLSGYGARVPMIVALPSVQPQIRHEMPSMSMNCHVIVAVKWSSSVNMPEMP